ncbi:MAG TPA: hypothetical protein VFS43_29715 [Polyangiaceae bacterium]|nr:hypothetical protein [Polyangiaceae bacterium]
MIKPERANSVPIVSTPHGRAPGFAAPPRPQLRRPRARQHRTARQRFWSWR